MKKKILLLVALLSMGASTPIIEPTRSILSRIEDQLNQGRLSAQLYGVLFPESEVTRAYFRGRAEAFESARALVQSEINHLPHEPRPMPLSKNEDHTRKASR